MSEADFDCVICPNCVHEFRAVPVNVQDKITRLESKVKELEALNESLQGMPEDVISQLKERFSKIDCGYRNSKEANYMQFLIGNIECGESSLDDAKAFLKVVPVGEYDSDRNFYTKTIRKAVEGE